MPKPSPANYVSYFQRYIDQVPEEDLMKAFKNQTAGMEQFLTGITEEKSMYAYAEGKWTIKELLQHIIDTERIFSYRALCFARNDQQGLPGFDEDAYAKHSHANKRTWADLVDECMAVRKSTEMLYAGFDKSVADNAGTANNNPATVSSMGFTTIGHYYHHKKILEERYL